MNNLYCLLKIFIIEIIYGRSILLYQALYCIIYRIQTT